MRITHKKCDRVKDGKGFDIQSLHIVNSKFHLTMKLHLPKCLYAAVVSAAMVATTYAANVADVSGTVTPVGKIPAPENATDNASSKKLTPIYVGGDIDTIKAKLSASDANRPVVYDAAGQTAVIENWGSEDAAAVMKGALFVRDGQLIVKDSVLKSSVSSLNTGLQVSGKNSTLTFDNSALTITGSQINSIGGKDGAGTMILTNESVVHMTTWLSFGGSHRTGGYTKCTAISPENTARYQDGVYTDMFGACYKENTSNHKYGTGTLVVDGGSVLSSDGGFTVAEANILLSGEGSIINTCLDGEPRVDKAGNGYKKGEFYKADDTIAENCVDAIGRGNGSVSTIRIEKGAVWNNGSSFFTIYGDVFETKVYLTVDGEGSALNVHNVLGIGSGSSSQTTTMSGSVGSTEMYVTNGATVTARSMYFGPQTQTIPGGGDYADTMLARRGANPVYVYVDAKSSLVAQEYFYVNKAYSTLHKEIKFNDNKDKTFEVNICNEGSISCNNFVLNGGNLHNAGTLNVAGTLTLKSGNLTMGLSQKHNTQAAITAGTVKVATADGSDYEVLVTVTENLKAGKYMLLDVGEEAETASTYSRAAAAPGKVKFILPEDINGMSLVMDEEGNAILTLSEQVLLTLDPLANAVQAANWGVQKSSQAFTSLLWQPRSAAAEVRTDSVDSKGMSVPAAPSSRTVAWGAAYSGFSSLSTSGNFCGADYSLYGGAIGVERQCAKGSSIGVALGYDWGKTSPHAVSRVNQDTMHAALYGRALNRKLGSKSSVALDWSAAVGNTTSEHDQLGSDWEQKSMQLDARATYGYELTNRTTLSGFAGAQYYAQESASTSRIHASSMQNLRLMLGGGVSYKATERTTLYGEATIYNDTMRHNPTSDLDGFYYGNGTNPGRLGGSISVGAQYQLNDKWSINGNYTYEGADNSDEQRVNVGASYTF